MCVSSPSRKQLVIRWWLPQPSTTSMVEYRSHSRIQEELSLLLQAPSLLALHSSLSSFPLFLAGKPADWRGLEPYIQRGTMLPNRVSRQFSPSVWRDTLPSGVWCTIDGGVERRRWWRRQSAKPAMASMASKLCDEKSSILSS